MSFKRKFFGITLLALTLSSCGTSLKEKGSIEQNGININPKSNPGYVGDVMPFYDNGEMNIFYLQDGRNTNLGFHPYALMTTKDYTSYKDYGVVIPFDNDIYSQDFALGTGSVIKDDNGLYHAFYTGYNGNKNSGLPYFEKIQHATSKDKLQWTKIDEDGFYGGCNDFRDPYVYKNEDNSYSMLITTRANDIGVIKEYTSSNLKNWSYKGIFFKNDSGSYNMECPTFIKYNDYYYLSYSEQGNNRVTHYRYKKNINDSWIKPSEDFLDGEGFYAGRMEKDESSLKMFGWCATRVGEYDTGKLDWGGNLVVHEMTQNEDGTLNATLTSSVRSKLNNEVSYKLNNGKELSTMSFSKDTAKAYQLEKLSANVTRITFDVLINDLDGTFGLSFNTKMNHLLSNLVLSFNLKGNNVAFYTDSKNFGSFGKIDTYVPYTFIKMKITIELVIDGEIITAYINNKKALTTRFYDMPNNCFSFFVNKADVVLDNIHFYE